MSESETNDLISVSVNGTVRREKPAITLTGLLDRLHDTGVPASGIAVAVNDEVVRRSAWNDTILAEGDRVEIVTARQGG